MQRIQFKQLDHWHLDTVLAPSTAKTRQENEETANHPQTASPKGRCRSLVCSQKTGRKGPDAVRSLTSGIIKLV
jgi:hypothetical protein